mmetsp:Transcript_47523/g.152258  ORF Transcript_47523/g.152258 Transcript_47523/m.152258 type:complete len:255 (-) Transcript_47523:192-956(-)
MSSSTSPPAPGRATHTTPCLSPAISATCSGLHTPGATKLCRRSAPQRSITRTDSPPGPRIPAIAASTCSSTTSVLEYPDWLASQLSTITMGESAVASWHIRTRLRLGRRGGVPGGLSALAGRGEAGLPIAVVHRGNVRADDIEAAPPEIVLRDLEHAEVHDGGWVEAPARQQHHGAVRGRRSTKPPGRAAARELVSRGRAASGGGGLAGDALPCRSGRGRSRRHRPGRCEEGSQCPRPHSTRGGGAGSGCAGSG